MKIDINIDVDIKDEEKVPEFGYPQYFEDFGMPAKCYFEFFDGGTEKSGESYIDASWLCNEVSQIASLSYSLDEGISEETWKGFGDDPEDHNYYFIGNSYAIPQASIESGFGNFDKKPISLIDDSDAHGRRVIGNGKYNIRVKLISSGDNVVYDVNPDLVEDGEEIGNAQISRGVDGSAVRYSWKNVKVGKFYIKVEEKGSRSYGHYVHIEDDNSEANYKVDWLPEGIFFNWFDTSDDTNFKITTTPDYTDDEVSGNIISTLVPAEVKVFLIPRRSFYYVRQTNWEDREENRTGGYIYLTQYSVASYAGCNTDQVGPMFMDSDLPNSYRHNYPHQENSEVIPSVPCVRSTGPDWNCYNEDLSWERISSTGCMFGFLTTTWGTDPTTYYEKCRTCNVAGCLDIAQCSDWDVSYTRQQCEDLCPEMSCTARHRAYSPITVNHYIGMWWDRLPHNFSLPDITDDQTYPLDIYGCQEEPEEYPTTLELSSIFGDRSESNAESDEISGGGDASDVEEILSGFNSLHVLGSGKNTRIYIDHGYYMDGSGSDKYTQGHLCPMTRGNGKVLSTTQTGFTWWGTPGDFDSAHPDSEQAYIFTPIWNKIENNSGWSPYKEKDDLDFTLRETGDSGGSDVPIGIGLSPTLAGELVGVVKVNNKVYYIWRKTDESFEVRSITSDPSYAGQLLQFENMKCYRNRLWRVEDGGSRFWGYVGQFAGSGRKLETYGVTPDIDCTVEDKCSSYPHCCHNGHTCCDLTVDEEEDGSFVLDAPVYLMATRDHPLGNSLVICRAYATNVSPYHLGFYANYRKEY